MLRIQWDLPSEFPITSSRLRVASQASPSTLLALAKRMVRSSSTSMRMSSEDSWKDMMVVFGGRCIYHGDIEYMRKWWSESESNAGRRGLNTPAVHVSSTKTGLHMEGQVINFSAVLCSTRFPPGNLASTAHLQGVESFQSLSWRPSLSRERERWWSATIFNVSSHLAYQWWFGTLSLWIGISLSCWSPSLF